MTYCAGHEITHGFDDKGRLFDCNGNLHRWWSDSAIDSFHHRAQCLINQYGHYIVPEVNMKLDGVNTQVGLLCSKCNRQWYDLVQLAVFHSSAW